MTVHTLKQCRPDQEETEYFWKLFHAAQRNDARWHGSEISIIADELSRTDLARNQKMFLLRAWQVLVDDKGGFGRFMGAFDTYVYNMQDPDDDCVAWKPELAQLLNDGNCFDVLLEAYEEAKHAAAVDHEAACSLVVENEELKRKLEAAERELDNWRTSFDNERFRADKLAEALKTEHEQLVMANSAVITQHMRANVAESRIAELESEKAELRPVGVMSEKAFYRLEQSESRFIALWPRPGIHLPRKRPHDSVIVYARVAAAGIGKGE
ncbi:TPA: hypothetical protein JD342_10040 [Citrobacter freundii]|uniref:hypothetical protein n=1 Tax=Citrobacter farmeri TaxID=67824 RepID=UPI001A260397|nr:hypothetical protein [Citrobacter farmeri]HAU5702990.1 hypothetical protein [Citrobacter freundii]